MFFKCNCDELKHFESSLASAVKDENVNVSEAFYRVSCHIAHGSEAI